MNRQALNKTEGQALNKTEGNRPSTDLFVAGV